MQQILRHQDHKSYVALYCACMVLHGINLVGLGSYIPYLSAKTEILQTQYSYLFTCRSAGQLMGAFFIKLLQRKKMNNHKLLAIGCFTISLFTCFINFTTGSFWLGTWMFMASMGYSVFEIILNVCFLSISPSEEVQQWMLIGHGAFGVGGILSPIIVYLFELNTFIVNGSLMLFLIPFFFKMKTPEETGFLPEHKTTPALHSRSISRTLQSCLCFFIFIYVGVECAYGGWIPSYVVLTGVTDHTGATKFPSLFWVLLTMFRFILAFAPGSSQKKLKMLIQGIVLTGIFSLGLIYAGHITLACYLSGILFGLSMSSVFPLVFTFPIEEGLVIEDTQATNIGIASVVAQGALTMMIGKLMEWIHVNMLFYSITFLAAVMLWIRYYSLVLIKKQKFQMREGGIEVELTEK